MSKRQRKLEQKRKQAIWNYFDDGIWELYFGLAALWLGLIVRFYWPVWYVFLILPLLFVPLWLKEKITLPRISKLKLTIQKRKGILAIGLVLLFANMVVLLVMKDEPGLTGLNEFLAKNDLVIASMVTGSICLYLAYAFGFQRLYSYAVLLFVGFFAEAWLFPEQRLGIVSFAGFIIVAAGVSLLLQFLRKNQPLSI
jgi:hypothetical protein